MKLSLIIPSYMGEKFIQKLVNSFSNQSDKDFEVVFIVDSTKDRNPLQYLLKLKEEKKNSVKILFNSKRQKRLTSIMRGIEKATGKYIAICSTKDSISNDFVEKINEIITAHSPDVIEYKFKYGKQKIEPELLTPKNTLINCRKNSSIIAYTIPFDFNKVIKRSLAKKFARIEYLDGGSRFDFSFTFNLMLAAKTYFAISSVLKITEVFPKTLISPRKMLKVVNQSMQQFEFKKNDDLHNAILYQGWCSLAIYQMQVVMMAKKNMIIPSLYNSLKKLRELPEYKYAHLHNPYFSREKLATEIIEFFPSIKSYKKLILKKGV